MGAPITIVAPGYSVELDRDPPRSRGGCGKLVFWISVLFAVIVAVGMMIYFAVRPQPERTVVIEQVNKIPATRIMPTITATMDYCWYLTPASEPTATGIPVTPDEWQLQGTAYALETGTPTLTPTATNEPPREWCNIPPTQHATATWTPIPRWTIAPEQPTSTITNTPNVPPTLDFYAIRPTSTLFPTLSPRWTQSPPQQQQPPPLPPQQQIIYVTQVVVEQVVVEQPVEQVIVVTATHTPTETSTPTLIPTSTVETPTATATIETPTATLTHTPTQTLTATPTATIEPTATWTLIPTSTMFPTLEPAPEETANATP